MGRILELGNAQNWEQVYTGNFTAQQITNTKFAPIPEQTIPIQLEETVLAVYIQTTEPDDKNWLFGGYCNQLINIPVTVGGAFNSTINNRKKIWLNTISLILFANYTTSYGVSFSFPKWFRDANIIVWQYTGINDDTTEKLITEEFLNINFKLDQIDSKL
jgi:hypothetical protein